MASEPEGLREFITDVSPALLRSAFLMTGDVGSAEDLVQAALVRAWRHWTKVQAAGQPHAYVRRILINEFLGNRRRRWSGEVAEDVPDREVTDPGFAAVEDRVQLRQALDELSPGQRAVVVLRYFDDLTEQQTADALGTSIGTVKSQCARAMARMRLSVRVDEETR